MNLYPLSVILNLALNIWSNALNDPYQDFIIYAVSRMSVWRYVREPSTLNSNWHGLCIWAGGLALHKSKLQKCPKSSGTRYSLND